MFCGHIAKYPAERAPLRCPPFLAVQSVNKTEFSDGTTECKREHTSTAPLVVVSVTVHEKKNNNNKKKKLNSKEIPRIYCSSL